MISFIKKHLTKLGFSFSVLDYDLKLNFQKKLLKFFLKLLTKVVRLAIAEYQGIRVGC